MVADPQDTPPYRETDVSTAEAGQNTASCPPDLTSRPPRYPRFGEISGLATTDDEVSDDGVIERRQGIPNRQHRRQKSGDDQTEYIGGICTSDGVKAAIPIPDLDSYLVGFSADTMRRIHQATAAHGDALAGDGVAEVEGGGDDDAGERDPLKERPCGDDRRWTTDPRRCRLQNSERDEANDVKRDDQP